MNEVFELKALEDSAYTYQKATSNLIIGATITKSEDGYKIVFNGQL